MKHLLFKLFAVIAMALSLSTGALAQYVDGNNPDMTTAVTARTWLIVYRNGKDFSKIGLSPAGVQVVQSGLQQFQAKYQQFVDQYNAQGENVRLNAVRAGNSTYTVDDTALKAQISGLVKATLAQINGQLSATDALLFSNAISNPHGITTSGTDADLGPAVAERNRKELSMIASHAMPGMAMPPTFDGMTPGYTSYNGYEVGTIINGTFTTKATDIYPSDIFETLGNGGLVNVEPNWGLIGNGPFDVGGRINVSGGQLSVSGGNYAPVFYHGGSANNPYSNMCVNINFSTTLGNQYFEIARQTSQGYGYVLWMQQGAMVVRAYTPAYPAGHDITGYYSVTPNAGDSSTLCAIGTQITAYYNDTQILNATNSEVAAGWPGMIGTVWAPSPASWSVSLPRYLAQTSEIYGSTTCATGCPPQAHHTPVVQSQTLNNRIIGGVQQGTPVSPSTYINFTATTYYAFDLVDNPGGDNPPDFIVWMDVSCSAAGDIWNPPQVTADLPWNQEWATSFMYVSGPGSNITAPLDLIGQYVLGGIAFTPTYLYPLSDDCTDGTNGTPVTSPPDFNPAFIATPNASQNTQYSYMMVKSICDYLPVVGEFADGLYACSPGWVKTYFSPAVAKTVYPRGFPCTYGFNGPKVPE